MDTPILTPAACEGTTTLFETDYFGEPAFLAQSGQLYNEADIYAFGRVYCFGQQGERRHDQFVQSQLLPVQTHGQTHQLAEEEDRHTKGRIPDRR